MHSTVNFKIIIFKIEFGNAGMAIFDFVPNDSPSISRVNFVARARTVA
jgi:hypothetical protein